MYQESLNTHQTDSEEQKISSTQNQFDDAKNFVKYPNVLIKNEKLYLPHILPIYSYLYSKINPSHELDITLQLIKDNFIKRSAQIYSKNEEYLKGLTFFTLNIKKETKPTIEIAPLIKIKELKEYIPNEPIPYDTTITQINKIVDKITKNNSLFYRTPIKIEYLNNPFDIKDDFTILSTQEFQYLKDFCIQNTAYDFAELLHLYLLIVLRSREIYHIKKSYGSLVDLDFNYLQQKIDKSVFMIKKYLKALKTIKYIDNESGSYVPTAYKLFLKGDKINDLYYWLS